MAYLVKLGEPHGERRVAGTPRASWLGRLRERPTVLIAVLAVGLLSGGAVIYQAIPHSPVIAREDPNSAQEIADDNGGSNAIAANVEVADDSRASRSASAR